MGSYPVTVKFPGAWQPLIGCPPIRVKEGVGFPLPGVLG